MNTKITFILIVIAIAFFIIPRVNAELPNNNVPVLMVESLDSNRVYFHLGKNIANEPDCAEYKTIVACSLDDKYCEIATKIALAAQLAGKNIEYDINGCLGRAAKLARLRIKP